MSGIDDNVSEIGEDLFTNVQPHVGTRVPESRPADTIGQHGNPTAGAGAKALRREIPAESAAGWGRGPVQVDRRKYKYDVLRGKASAPLSFSASRVDRMDAAEAGELLDAIHRMYGIDRAEEARLVAFDKALFFEHAINGASLLQPGRGYLTADGMQFDIQPLKEKLGVEQRRFFRAYADDVALVNKEVLDGYDHYDPESVEKVGYLRQLAAVRGLQKYPHLVHDSSDAGTGLSYDERAAIASSKRVVLESTVNNADSWIAPRSGQTKLPSGENGSTRTGGS